mmetsp:Transcript_120182/g.236165  ORF Transcript_120182/g.236165 Transcript_120182/m.236165 type:complete len:250 (-) Transcript_120182:129-878(-)
MRRRTVSSSMYEVSQSDCCSSASTKACFAMRAWESCSDSKSRSKSRTSAEGTMAWAAGRDCVRMASKFHTWKRTSGKGFVFKFFITTGTSRRSATLQSSNSGACAMPGAGAALLVDGGLSSRSAAQQAIAPLQTSLFVEAVCPKMVCKRPSHCKKKAKPAGCREMFAQAFSAQSRSVGSLLSSNPAMVCARGASRPGNKLAMESGARRKTKPMRRTTQRRTEGSQQGSSKSRTSFSGVPLRLRKSWPAG